MGMKLFDPIPKSIEFEANNLGILIFALP